MLSSDARRNSRFSERISPLSEATFKIESPQIQPNTPQKLQHDEMQGDLLQSPPTFSNGPSEPEEFAVAIESTLRGTGQIMQCGNQVSGLLFLGAIASQSLSLACVTAVGSSIGGLTARVFKYDTHTTESGLHGFNAALISLATMASFAPSGTSMGLLVAGCVASTVASEWARKRGLELLAAPYVVIMWGILALGEHLGLAASQFTGNTMLVLGNDLLGTLTSTGQVLFQQSPLAGALCLAGVALKSTRAATSAALGALLAGVAATAMGHSTIAIESGLIGCNAALTAIALHQRPALATAGVIMTVPLYTFFTNLGMPVLLAPFVLATAIASLAVPTSTPTQSS